MDKVKKHAVTIPVSSGLLSDGPDLNFYFERYRTATPEERDSWQRQALAAREATRKLSKPVPLTLDALLDKLGWSREYAEHVIQPYCECSDDQDGWQFCEHARDLKVAPY